jgi:hypothetical protein
MTLAVLFAGLATAQTGLEGHWDGALQLPDREMPISVDLAKNAKGDWIASFGVPPQKLKAIPVSNIAVDGKSVKFQVTGIPGTPAFSCTLGEPEQMKCEVAGPQGAVPAKLKRTGAANVELPTVSPAVSKELEGDWEGAIETPGGPLRLVLHLVNQPDKTVKATVDSPMQNATGLALSAVTQSESTLEFRLPLVSGSFKGTINKAMTEIAGEWSQGSSIAPLKFTRPTKK